jgi:preprotein translocase subunit YajC
MCGGAGGMQSLIFMVLMFAVFYFILIRPQQKRAREHTNMINGLKKDDVVITRGGVIGKITGVADNVLTIEVQEKVRIRVLKSYVEGRHDLSKSTSTSKAETKAESKSEPAPESK